MATAATTLAGHTATPAGAAAAPGARHGRWLLVALLLACLYAAFADGAVGLPEETRLQVGLALLALAAAVTGAGGRGLRASAPREAWWAVGLLVAFAAWATLSLAWSILPDRTWQEVNRALAYALVVVLAIAAGTSAPRAVERCASGLLAVSMTVALYALGGKVLPGVDIGPIDLDHAATVSRLRAPLEYWNALGLLCALGVPLALRIATDTDRSRWARVGALEACLVLVAVLGMTYSRGAFLALAAALVVVTALGGARLRGLVAALAVSLAAVPVLASAYSLESLTTNAAPLGDRIDDGLRLLFVLAVSMIALGWGGRWLLRLEARTPWSPARSAQAWRALAALAACGALLGSVVVASGEGGWNGRVARTVDGFTQTARDETFDPVRLASTNSGNRWSWWKEAVGGWADRPVGGWGAGSFPLVHKRYRVDEVPVRQPHSVPLQFLVETGLIGAGLALGGLGLLLWVALARVATMRPGRERDLGVALLAAAAAWSVHGLVDWDWDIPGVTVPVLLALGVLCARPGAARPGAAPFRDVDAEGRAGAGPALALGLVCVVLAAYVASAVLPAWSDSAASDAAAMVDDDPTPAELEDAAARAQLAARLDPLATRPLIIAASIAEGRGRLLDARRYLLQAADRAPDDPDVWLRLAGMAAQLADRDGFRDAARRLLALDPVNGTARALAQRAESGLAPPNASATAVGTPLPVAVAPAPVPVAPVPAVPTVPPVPTVRPVPQP